VLLNLVSNAVKYTHRGGISIRARVNPTDKSDRVLLSIEVEDTGVGIAASDQARVFDPFIQVGNRAGHKGTGLGLSISRQFLELMGGRISVESTLGEGILFRIELPVERAERSKVTGARGVRQKIVGISPGQPEYRILIVEDQKENGLLLRRLLEHAGFRVLVAEDGPQGIEMYRTWRPDFIWMDIRLPGMSGLEAAQHIRRLDGGLDVKIAAVTASAFAAEREAVLATGIDDFVRKPYRLAEIFECLERHLGVRYRYAGTGAASAGEPVKPLEQQRLAALPKELRGALCDAVVSLDPERIAALIERVREHDAELGSLLETYAEGFAYSPILNALGATIR
jgi:CheY-like chemotaxis protein